MNEKMIIAFIGQRGIAATYGGVEKHVEEIAARLAVKGYKVTVYCRSRYANVSGDYRGIRVVRLPAINQKHLEMISHTFFSIMHLLLSRKKIDIIHVQSVDPAILIPLAKLKAKVVATSHGQVYLQSGKWGQLAKTFSKIAEGIFIHFSDRRIAISKTLRDYYEKRYHREVAYIPNGADIPAINDSKEIKRLDLKKDGYVLYVGRLVPNKGCHLLMNAYKSIKTDKKLIIVGGSSYSSVYVKNLKESAKGNDNINFLGYQYGRVLQELFANCSLFVFPSKVEGMPVVLLEAMSFAKPIIFSDIPANIEVADGVAIPFRCGDIDDLSQKLRYALENLSLCYELGEKARERVKKEYHWDKIVHATEEVYHSLFR